MKMTTRLAVAVLLLCAAAAAFSVEYTADIESSQTPGPNQYQAVTYGRIYYRHNSDTDVTKWAMRIDYFRDAGRTTRYYQEIYNYALKAKYVVCSTCEAFRIVPEVHKIYYNAAVDTSRSIPAVVSGCGAGFARTAEESAQTGIKYVWPALAGGSVPCAIEWSDGRVMTYKSFTIAPVADTYFTAPTGCPQPVCPTIADVVFMVDSSSSISDTDYKTQKTFLTNFVNGVAEELASKNLQIGITKFSDQHYSLPIQLLTSNKATLLSKITSLSKNIYTCLGCAIRDGYNVLKASTRDVEQARILILITDGRPTAPCGETCTVKPVSATYPVGLNCGSPTGLRRNTAVSPSYSYCSTPSEADSLSLREITKYITVMNSGVKVPGDVKLITVAVGKDLDQTYLKNLATQITGVTTHFNVAEGYSMLDTILDSILRSICSVPAQGAEDAVCSNCGGPCCGNTCDCPVCPSYIKNDDGSDDLCKPIICVSGRCTVNEVKCYPLTSDTSSRCTEVKCNSATGQCTNYDVPNPTPSQHDCIVGKCDPATGWVNTPTSSKCISTSSCKKAFCTEAGCSEQFTDPEDPANPLDPCKKWKCADANGQSWVPVDLCEPSTDKCTINVCHPELPEIDRCVLTPKCKYDESDPCITGARCDEVSGACIPTLVDCCVGLEPDECCSETDGSCDPCTQRVCISDPASGQNPGCQAILSCEPCTGNLNCEVPNLCMSARCIVQGDTCINVPLVYPGPTKHCYEHVCNLDTGIFVEEAISTGTDDYCAGFCDELTGKLQGESPCIAGTACNYEECVSDTSECVPRVKACDVGQPITGNVCKIQTGMCREESSVLGPVAVCTTEDLICEDNNPCKPLMGCDPAFGCQYGTVICGDSDACTIRGCDATKADATTNGTALCFSTPVEYHDKDLCHEYTCDPTALEPWLITERCQLGLGCRKGLCRAADGVCLFVSTKDCFIEDDAYKLCFRSACQEIDGGKCVAEPVPFAYFDLCGKCIDLSNIPEDQVNITKLAANCVSGMSTPKLVGAIAGGVVAAIVIVGAIILVALLASSYYGAKELLKHSRLAKNQTPVNNPLYEGDGNAGVNPAYAGEDL